MIQDIGLGRYHVEYVNKAPSAEMRCAVFQKNTSLLRETADGMLEMPLYGEVADITENAVRVFSIEDTEYVLAFLKEGAEIPEGLSWQTLIREIRGQKTRDHQFAEMTAFHLYTWYSGHRFCGRCGAPAVHDEKERMMRCPACGNMMFPVIAPAVIIAVTHKGRLLMTRYRGRVYKGYALIAGFTEVGESAEDTVRREVMEEAGLKVKDIRYYGSQPWGSASNLLLGYFCRLDGDDDAIRMDDQELAMAEWMAPEDITDEPDNYTLTNEMMMAFRSGEWD